MQSRIRMLLLFVLCMIAIVAAMISQIACIVTGASRRFDSISIGLDQTGNACLGGAPDETISSRAGRRWPRIARIINWLFCDPEHCASAIASDRRDAKRMIDSA